MNIHEHQAKDLLKQFEIPVPNGVVIHDLSEIEKKVQYLKSSNLAVKAQIHAGGRGKAGGIKLVKSKKDLITEATKMFGKVNGTLTLRKQQPKIEILDEGLLFESGQFVRTKTTSSIDKAGIRNHVKETGEIPEGVEFVQQDCKFGYKVNFM